MSEPRSERRAGTGLEELMDVHKIESVYVDSCILFTS